MKTKVETAIITMMHFGKALRNFPLSNKTEIPQRQYEKDMKDLFRICYHSMDHVKAVYQYSFDGYLKLNKRRLLSRLEIHEYAVAHAREILLRETIK